VKRLLCCLTALCVSLSPQVLCAETSLLPEGVQIELPAAKGPPVSLPLGGDTRFTVLCFLGTECPLARLYGPRLESLSQRFAEQDVRFVGVNSNHQDSLDEVRQYVERHGITFPMAKDYDHAAADRFQMERTPEVCVIDQAGVVRYRGRIDDQHQPGLTRPAPTRNDLELAIEELLAGRAVSVPRTTAVGCLIGRPSEVKTPTELTYCRDVSRVLQRHCVECHRAGDIAPFALTEFDEVVGWGETMLEVIADGRMPPWHASDDSGPFINARGMPEEDRQALREWVAGGMPFGSVADLPPPLPAVEEGWKLAREPDLVIPMREQPFVVPAEGVVEYQYFVSDPGLAEDRWVIGAEVMPGNRSVVHHCIVFIRPPDGADLRGMGWLTAYVPGQRITMLPPGMGRRIPAGSRLVFQMHYTPTGVEQQDLTRVGLIFGNDAEVEHEVFTMMAINQDFEIPPGASDHRVTADLTRLPKKGRLLALAPHMHVRGKSCEIAARRGSNESLLLKVPRYDFNWQHVYAFEEPLDLSQVDKLEMTAHFDNSAANPVNPDPSQYVHWGDQTWEEMAVAFFEVATPRDADGSSRPRRAARNEPVQRREAKAFVEDFFERFDANRDRAVVESELPLAMQRFAFHRLDKDDDGRLIPREIEELAEEDLTER
jgi:hypothetical protein